MKSTTTSSSSHSLCNQVASHATSSPHTTSPASAPNQPQHTMTGVQPPTRSIFPPFPPNIPVDPLCFSFSFSASFSSSSPFPLDEMKNRGKSTKFSVFDRVLVHHANVSSLMSDHVTSIVSSVSNSSDRARFSSSPSNRVLLLYDKNQIRKIYITQSKMIPSQYIFYVYCYNQEACQHIRHIIQQHTSIQTHNVNVRYVIGRVYYINHGTNMHDVVSWICNHDSRITSFGLTPHLHAFPSSHPRASAYFWIRSDECQFLRDLPALPGHNQALKFEQYTPPKLSLFLR